MRAYTMTHVGLVREQNEDTIRVCAGEFSLYILADGMGGHQAGEVASKMAADVLEDDLRGEIPSRDKLTQAFYHANSAIYEKQLTDEKLSGMGTTLTVLWEGDTHVLVGHVGDSRAYLMVNGRLRSITEDHSVVAEMVRSGAITEEQARIHPYRSVITRAMGTEETVKVDMLEVLKTSGEKWLLCSDGLSDLVEDDKIEDILATFDSRTAVEMLVDSALKAGGRDNISVMVLEVGV